jgi:hypothetical protein
MQKGQRIYKDCSECYATGTQYQNASGSIQSKQSAGDIEVDCPTCNGLGIVPWGWLREAEEEIMPGDV